MSRVDLENFPTNRAAKEMIEMISPIYQDSYVGKWIFEVMGVPFSLAEDTVDAWVLELFPATCTWTMSYWEMAYGLPVIPTRDLELRREILLRKINTRKPMNPARIIEVVYRYTGLRIDLIENVAPRTVEIVIYDSIVDIGAVRRIIKRVKQSHIAFNITIVSDVALKMTVGQRPWKLAYKMPMGKLAIDRGTIIVHVGIDEIPLHFIPTGVIRSGTAYKPAYDVELYDYDIDLAVADNAIHVKPVPAGVLHSGMYPEYAYRVEKETPAGTGFT